MSNIDITIEVDGKPADVKHGELGALRHQLDDPDSPVQKPQQSRHKKEVKDPALAAMQPRSAVYASTAVNLGDASQIKLPSEQSIGGKKSIEITDDQMATIARKHEIDAYTKGALSVLTPEKTGMDNHAHLKKIEEAVHAVMQEILQGNNLLRIPPSEVFHVVDTLRDHAFAYANHCASNGTPPCVETLKNTMRNHHAVKTFTRMHHDKAGLASDANHHPRTGVPSPSVLAGHSQYHGVCTSRHGLLYNHEHNDQHERW